MSRLSLCFYMYSAVQKHVEVCGREGGFRHGMGFVKLGFRLCNNNMQPTVGNS